MRFAGLLVLLAALFSTAPSRAEQVSDRPALMGRYFIVVWGFEGPDNDVVHSHTFASFYKGDELAKGILRPTTISWLPATGVVEPFGSEPGHNFTLSQTLKMACRLGRTVKSWGPYEIEPALYQRALRRVGLLNSGRMRYAMIDTNRGTMNCIDAAGDLTPIPFDSGIAWGFVASDAVVQHLAPYFKKSRPVNLSLKRMLTRHACHPPGPTSH